MLLIISSDLSFVEIEDLLHSLGIELNPQPTATMFNVNTGKKLFWIKRSLWGNSSIPLRLDELPFTITKRLPLSCHISI